MKIKAYKLREKDIDRFSKINQLSLPLDIALCVMMVFNLTFELLRLTTQATIVKGINIGLIVLLIVFVIAVITKQIILSRIIKNAEKVTHQEAKTSNDQPIIYHSVLKTVSDSLLVLIILGLIVMKFLSIFN